MSTVTTIASIHASSPENDINFAPSLNPWALYITSDGVDYPDSTLRLVIRAKDKKVREKMVEAAYAALNKSKGKSGNVADSKRVVQYSIGARETLKNKLQDNGSKKATVNGIECLSGGPYYVDCSSFMTLCAYIGMGKIIDGGSFHTSDLENLALQNKDSFEIKYNATTAEPSNIDEWKTGDLFEPGDILVNAPKLINGHRATTYGHAYMFIDKSVDIDESVITGRATNKGFQNIIIN